MFHTCGNIPEFLAKEERMPLHALDIKNPNRDIAVSYDIDGAIAELHKCMVIRA